MYIKFNYDNLSKDVLQGDAFVDEYSNHPDKLEKIIRELSDVSCFMSYAPAPWDSHGIHRLKSNVELTYKGKTLAFSFWHSMVDTIAFERYELESEFLSHVLYDLLCTIACESNFFSESFEYFCDTSGFDLGSSLALAQYKEGCKVAKKMISVFNADDLASFPS